MTSNCAGQPAGCAINSATGFDVASFMLGLVNTKTRNLFDATPYTETRPEYALYVQDDFRATSRLTINLGLRWDVYPPWVEVNNLQSNFDETTGKFVVASDDAVIGGVKVGPLPADLLEARLRPALRLRLRPRLATARRCRPRRLRHLLELHARRHLVVQGAEPAVPAVHRAERRIRPPTASTCCSGTACRRRPASIRPARRPARRGRSSTSTSATPTRASGTSTSSGRSATNYMVEVAYVGSQGRQMLLKGDPNQAPPVVGRQRLERQPAVRDAGAGAAHDRPGPERRARSTTTRCWSSSSAASPTTSRSSTPTPTARRST